MFDAMCRCLYGLEIPVDKAVVWMPHSSRQRWVDPGPFQLYLQRQIIENIPDIEGNTAA